MKLTIAQADELLAEGLAQPETIRYVAHCRYVGALAGMIAAELGEDAVYAACLGLLHDIGRKIDPADHAYAGYRFLLEKGLDLYAPICLTHSFLNNQIEMTAGRPFRKDHPAYAFIQEYVAQHENTVYDRIVQLCDLLCLHSGGTTLEERLSDIESRKGRHDKSKQHYELAVKQLAKLEALLGHSVYTFYERLNRLQFFTETT